MRIASWSNMSKQAKHQLIGGVIMAILGIMLVRQYLPEVQLPTNGRIAEEEMRLNSKLSDLAVQRKMNEDFNAEIDGLRGKMSMFWTPGRVGVPVEQEVLDEFNRVVRLSGVNIQNKEAKLLKNANATFIQEVEIRLDMRDVTMREYTRFMQQISQNKRKFYWYQCRIEPDNVQKPMGLKVSARLRAFVLTEDASTLLDSGEIVVPDIKGQKKSAFGRPTRQTRGARQ